MSTLLYYTILNIDVDHSFTDIFYFDDLRFSCFKKENIDFVLPVESFSIKLDMIIIRLSKFSSLMIIFQTKKKSAYYFESSSFFSKSLNLLKFQLDSILLEYRWNFKFNITTILLSFFNTITYSDTSSIDTSLFVIKILIKIEFLTKL